MVDFGGSIGFKKCEPREIKVTVINSGSTNLQLWARLSLYTPPSVAVLSERCVTLPLNLVWGAKAEASFVVDASNFDGARLEMMLDVSLEGRHSYGGVKLVLMPGA